MRMNVSTHVNAPKDAVFAAVSDFANAGSIVSAIDDVEMLSRASDGSAVGVGTRFKETRTMFGKQAAETMEVTVFDPPRAFTLSANSCGMTFNTRVTVLEEQPGGGGGCRLIYDVQGKPASLISRITSPIMGLVMKGAMCKGLRKDLQDIKQHLEQHAEHRTSEFGAGQAEALAQ